MEPEDVVGVLVREPVPLTVARQPVASGGAPSELGLYAWWAAAGAPPLNQAANGAHPLYPVVRAARRRWTESARPA